LIQAATLAGGSDQSQSVLLLPLSAALASLLPLSARAPPASRLGAASRASLAASLALPASLAAPPVRPSSALVLPASGRALLESPLLAPPSLALALAASEGLVTTAPASSSRESS
jgi:hypothetical protein